MSKLDEVKAQLKTLIEEELKAVTYKWLARENNINANLAKQYLFAYAEGKRGIVNTTYLLAGWTKEHQRHVIQLVSESKLKEAKAGLSKVSGLHVYSIQPGQPKDASHLWNAEMEQTSTLFDAMVKKLASNCLSDNRLSAVHCEEAERDPDIAKRLPAPPQPEAPKPASKPAGGAVAAKIDGIMAGRTANKGGVASASVAVGDNNDNAKQAITKGPASAPAASLVKKGSGDGVKAAGPPATGAGRGRKGSALGSMWSKAPAKSAAAKQQAAASKDKPAPGRAVDAQAQLQAQTDEEDSDEEEDFKPAQRSRAPAVLSDESDEEDVKEEADEESNDRVKQTKAVQKPSTAPPDGKTHPPGTSEGKKTGQKAKAKPTSSKRKATSQESDPVGIEEDEDQQSKPKEKTKSSKPKLGSVKAGAPAGTKRRKIQRTIINDNGEEVTEDVWEDVPGGTPEEIESSPPPDPPKKTDTQKEKSKVTTKNAGGKGESPGKKALAEKSAAAKQGKSGAAQKNITSFFGKK